jgi:ABC-type molybdate transport system substrate-binding protein
VSRRPVIVPLFALVAMLVVVLGACSSTPAAPALTDPKDILTKAATSLTDVKTFEFTGSFTGAVKVQGSATRPLDR